MQKIFGIIGWIGTVLVFGAVAVRMFYPDWNQYATYAAWAGLVVGADLHGRPVARRRRVLQGTRRQVRHACPSSASSCFSASSSRSTISARARTSAGTSPPTRSTACRIRRSRSCKDLKEPVQVTVFERNDRQDVHKDRLQEYQYQTTQAQDRVHRSRPRADARRSGEDRVAADDPVRIPGPHRARHLDQRTGPDQRADQGRHRHDAQGLLHAGPRREGHRVHRSQRLQHRGRGDEAGQLRRRTARADPAEDGSGRCDDRRHRRSDDGFLPAGDRRAERLCRQGRQGDGDARSAAEGPGAAAARRSSSPTGASAPAPTSSSTRAAWDRCSAPTRRCRWRRSIRRIRSPKASASSPHIRWRDR